MTTKESAPVAVTQADREAAADTWNHLGSVRWTEWQSEWMRAGTSDYGPVVQGFARHRLAALAQPRAAMVVGEAVAFVRDVAAMVGEELEAHTSPELRDRAREIVAAPALQSPPAAKVDREAIANAAVTENLNPDGTPKWESAFGYACALSAIRLALQPAAQGDAAGPGA